MFDRTGAPTKKGPTKAVCFRKDGLKLPDSCCCNSRVHCSTGPQQNVDDDYCACQVKTVGGGGGEYSYIWGPHFFLNRGPTRSKSGPVTIGESKK